MHRCMLSKAAQIMLHGSLCKRAAPCGIIERLLCASGEVTRKSPELVHKA